MKPPTFFVAEVLYRCPTGERVVYSVGPTAREAIRKGAGRADEKFTAMRCRKIGAKIVKRGSGAGLEGARPCDLHKLYYAAVRADEAYTRAIKKYVSPRSTRWTLTSAQKARPGVARAYKRLQKANDARHACSMKGLRYK